MPVAAIRGSRVPLVARLGHRRRARDGGAAPGRIGRSSSWCRASPWRRPPCFPVLLATLAIGGFRRLVAARARPLARAEHGRHGTHPPSACAHPRSSRSSTSTPRRCSTTSGRAASCIPLPPDAAELRRRRSPPACASGSSRAAPTPGCATPSTESAYLSHRVTRRRPARLGRAALPGAARRAAARAVAPRRRAAEGRRTAARWCTSRAASGPTNPIRMPDST